jgi:hypothetical protein
MPDYPPEPRLVEEGEVFNRDDVRAGRIRLPDPPDPRPEPPLAKQHERWSRLDELADDSPEATWARERLSGHDSE